MKQVKTKTASIKRETGVLNSRNLKTSLTIPNSVLGRNIPSMDYNSSDAKITQTGYGISKVVITQAPNDPTVMA